jgi:hypothetical protein
MRTHTELSYNHCRENSSDAAARQQQQQQQQQQHAKHTLVLDYCDQPHTIADLQERHETL